MNEWPDWWSWELELSSHVLKRMRDRQFNEADLRLMFEEALGYDQSHEPGRWIIQTRRDRHTWEIVVEPIPTENVLVVITAYPIE